MEFEDICSRIKEYQSKTGLMFMLKSLKNFAANGRVSPAVAKIAGVLGICVVGKASEGGTLEPVHKCRGEKKSLSAMVEMLKESGLRKGKVRLAHCMNETAAHDLKKRILAMLPEVEVKIHTLRGLCSYYAEKGGLLVGFERM
jgi:fatty acid-binding protein DegV